MSSARIVGVIAVVLFGLLFLATLVASWGPNKIVIPTNGVTAGGPSDNPAGKTKLGVLEDRSKLQAWPGDTTSSGVSSHALGPTSSSTPDSGGQLVQEWTGNKGANRDILDKPRLLRGVATLPGAERDVLMQPQGRTWRDVHNDKLAYGGGIYVLGITALIALFLAWRGRIPVAEGESGERLQRFNAFERANHWLTAGSFILMALTGLVILYGNGLIRPWLGASAYSELARVSAWSHMAFAVPFAIGVVVMIFVWIRQNLPERLDWAWLKQGGGFMRNDGNNPPARKFNAGQKIVFWGVALAGLALIVTGVGLMFPFFWSGYTGMQLAQSLHTAIALLLIGLIIGHIYIGTIGMQGAIDAMWSGWVDRNWAKEHHSLWYRTIAPERTSADRAPPPRVRAARSSLAGIGSFATGIVAAIVLSLVMYAIYEQANVRTANSTKNPAVHLDGEFAQGVAPVRK